MVNYCVNSNICQKPLKFAFQIKEFWALQPQTLKFGLLKFENRKNQILQTVASHYHESRRLESKTIHNVCTLIHSLYSMIDNNMQNTNTPDTSLSSTNPTLNKVSSHLIKLDIPKLIPKLNKLPLHLIKLDSKNTDGEQIFKALLLLAKNCGGWSVALGHKKKGPFMEKAAESLFNINGQFNQ